MHFNTPTLLQVDQQKLAKIHGLVHDVAYHMDESEHLSHSEYVNVRLQMLDNLLSELRGLNQKRHETMD